MNTRGLRTLSIALAVFGCDAGRHVSPEKELDPNQLAQRALAVADLTVTPYIVGMSLSWKDVPNATSFRVLRSTSGANGAFTTIATTSQNVARYDDPAIASETQYCYRVEALQKARVAKTTTTVCATSLAFGPSPAYDVVAMWTPPNGVSVTWHDSSTQLTGYHIDRAPAATGPWNGIATVGPTTTSYNDYDGAVEQLLCYRVIAMNAQGDAKPSNVSCTVLPAAPLNVVAKSIDGHTIDVTWTDASAYEDNYRVRRSTDGAEWSVIATLPANTTTYRDIGLTSNILYWYVIDAMKGNLARSSAYVTTMAADAPPIDAPALTRVYPFGASSVGLEGSAVGLEWTAVANAAAYYLDRSLDNLATWQRVVTSTLTYPGYYDYRGPIEERLVCYRVTAYNDRGQSPTSEPRCTAPPAAPSNLTAALFDDQTVGLTWSDNSNVEDGFEIYASIYDDWTGNWISFSVATLPANTTTHRLTELGPYTDYAFQVYAKRDGGWSNPSGYAFASTGAMPSSSAAATFRVVRGKKVPSSWRGPIDDLTLRNASIRRTHP